MGVQIISVLEKNVSKFIKHQKEQNTDHICLLRSPDHAPHWFL